MKRILLLVLATFSIWANAAAPISDGWWVGNNFVGSSAESSSTASAVCASYFGSATYTGTFARYTNSDTAVARCLSGSTYVGERTYTRSAYCAYGAKKPNTALPLGQQCSDPPVICTAGTKSTFDAYTGSGPVGATSASVNARTSFPTSDGSCNVSVSGVEVCYSQPSVRGQDFFCTFTATRNGAVTPTGEANNDPQPSLDRSQDKPATTGSKSAGEGKSCPSGTVALGVDSAGGMICGGAGTSPATPPKTETKNPAVTTNNPDGSTTKVETSTRSNSDGSTTTTTTTTVTGANGGTTVTQSSSTSQKPAASGGGGGKDDSSDDKKDDFCIKNPTLNVCKNSEVMAGSCSDGNDSTSCTGDAIQCAILREQKRQYCALQKENDSATLGNQAIAGNDPKKGDLPTKDNAAQINMQSLDQAGFLGGGSCFQDKTFTVQGLTVTMPFSKVCPYLEWLRYVVMVIAALVSLKIVSKPVLGD